MTDAPLDRMVIATGNPHKVRELREIFEPMGIDACPLSDLGAFDEPAETGATFEANAIIKARRYAQLTGLACLADDSGLETDALGGRPGVISSHYATDGVETGLTREQRDAANIDRLLGELAGLPEAARGARFVCVMALAAPSLVSRRGAADHREADSVTSMLALSRGVFEGRIGLPPSVPRGSNGFGYDPVFLVAPDFRQTSAELTPERKHALSHRGAAARGMAEQIRRVLAR